MRGGLFRTRLACADRRGAPKSVAVIWIGACSTWNTSFLPLWRRYQRALKQRNSLLRVRQRTDDAACSSHGRASWRRPAQLIDQRRQRLPGTAAPATGREHAGSCCRSWATLQLRYRRGWSERARACRAAARAAGHAIWPGSHHAGCPSRRLVDCLRTGTAARASVPRPGKAHGLACMLAQAELYAEHHGEWPVVCLDDLASELDPAHQARCRGSAACGAGAGAADRAPSFRRPCESRTARVFHVEQGQLARLL